MADEGQSKSRTILWHDVDGSRHRRPAGTMTIHQQIIVGRILSAIQASPIVPGLVKVNLMFFEEELADWVAEEAAAAGAKDHHAVAVPSPCSIQAIFQMETGPSPRTHNQNQIAARCSRHSRRS